MANATTRIQQLLVRHWVVAGFALLLAGGLAYWRFNGPVLVHLTANIDPTLPFEVQIEPEWVMARPGEVINAVYRIHNQSVTPLEAFGRLTIEPGSANEQLKVFLTQCSGLNTFQNVYPEEYDVVFRVAPAGITGSSFIMLHHEFVRATMRP
jgi:cytochrome c oxidase assembly protein Cox11